MERKRSISLHSAASYILRYTYAFVCCILWVCCLSSFVRAADNPLIRMKDETMSFFKPVTGRITSMDGGKIRVDVGSRDSVRKGMRFQVLREEAPFRHPVTKEPLGALESLVGDLEIKEAGEDSSEAGLVDGAAKEGDKIRISALKVNLLFCQSKETDWNLADTYYRMLKDTGRFNLVDTSLDTEDPSLAVEEAKRLKAEVTLLLTAKNADSGVVLTQRLFWTSDGSRFSEMSEDIDTALLRDIGAREAFFKPVGGKERLQLDLAFDARHITVCDIDGDGKKEIALSSGNRIGFYTLGADLQPALGGIRIGLSNFDDVLWLDAIDLNGNGRDEIVITSMKADGVESYIYEVSGSEFVLLYKEGVFLRRVENGLVAQEYSRAQGYTGDVFNVIWDGGYRKGGVLRMPKGVNIYDFTYLEDPRRGRVLLAYDEDGFLSVYDDKAVKIWRSKEDTGGFLRTFERKAASSVAERGEWSIKDRLVRLNGEVLAVERVHFVEMIKGLGFRNSRMIRLRWNGLTMEEEVMVGDISGTLFDYAVEDGRVIVLSSPVFGVKPERLLRGESPLKTDLSIYVMKGF